MIKKNMILVIDIDGTLCPIKKIYESYTSIIPFKEIVNKLIELRSLGWYIILHSARGMASKDGNIGKINAEVLPDLLNWLKKNKRSTQVIFHLESLQLQWLEKVHDLY